VVAARGAYVDGMTTALLLTAGVALLAAIYTAVRGVGDALPNSKEPADRTEQVSR
jgi:hypothetical protein